MASYCGTVARASLSRPHRFLLRPCSTKLHRCAGRARSAQAWLPVMSRNSISLKDLDPDGPVFVDKTGSDREINALRRPPVDRSIRRAACYNLDFMFQLFIAVLGALRVFFHSRGDTCGPQKLRSAANSQSRNLQVTWKHGVHASLHLPNVDTVVRKNNIRRYAASFARPYS